MRHPGGGAIFDGMYEISEGNVVPYLQKTGRLTPESAAQAKILAWGVSNVVLRIHPDNGSDFVVKQSREKLRTKADWFSRLDRIWREVEVMRALGPLLPSGVIPQILFEDRENYLFGMEAVDAEHVVWKEELLAGRADATVAATLGEYLGTIHAATTGNETLWNAFGDRQVFDELRIDPFYRRIAQVHPDLRPAVSSLIDETFAISLCVVHADFSPKNVLLTNTSLEHRTEIPSRRISLVDFETGHFGDPAFDLGFFLSHLLLKSIRHAARSTEFLKLARDFWRRYRDTLTGIATSRSPGMALLPNNDLERRAIGHLAGCLLARIDGKSTVDYLNQPSEHNLVRDVSRGLFLDPPPRLENVFDELAHALSPSK